MKSIFEEIIYRQILAVFWLLGSMPLSWSRRCGVVFGRIGFFVSRSQRKTAIKNLGIAFPEMTHPERHNFARKVFENLGQTVFEIFWSYRLNEKSLSRYVNLEGLENIRNASAEGRGVLILTAHFGNWEVMTVLGAMLGYPVNIVYQPIKYTPLERLVMKLRTRFGASQIPRKNAFRKIIRALEEKNMVALLFDMHVPKNEGVFVHFFGRPAATSNGLALLALKTQAPVIPLFLVREKNGFSAHFLPKVPLVQTGDKVKDVLLNTEEYNRVIEGMIRRYPEQWWWVEKRWRGRDIQYWVQQQELQSN